MIPLDTIPLLIVDDIRRDEKNKHRVAATVRVGGHPTQVVLDYSCQEWIIEHIEMPPLLSRHVPSQQAVVKLISEFEAGKPMEFPIDLSESIVDAVPPPFLAPTPADELAMLEHAADLVQLEVLSMKQIASAPARFELTLRLDGISIKADAEVHGGSQCFPYIRWLHGPPLKSLSVGQRYAIQRELLKYI